MCVYLCVYQYSASGGQKRSLDPLKLELQVVVVRPQRKPGQMANCGVLAYQSVCLASRLTQYQWLLSAPFTPSTPPPHTHTPTLTYPTRGSSSLPRFSSYRTLPFQPPTLLICLVLVSSLFWSSLLLLLSSSALSLTLPQTSSVWTLPDTCGCSLPHICSTVLFFSDTLEWPCLHSLHREHPA